MSEGFKIGAGGATASWAGTGAGGVDKIGCAKDGAAAVAGAGLGAAGVSFFEVLAGVGAGITETSGGEADFRFTARIGAAWTAVSGMAGIKSSGAAGGSPLTVAPWLSVEVGAAGELGAVVDPGGHVIQHSAPGR